jgi:hypothetical protein
MTNHLVLFAAFVSQAGMSAPLHLPDEPTDNPRAAFFCPSECFPIYDSAGNLVDCMCYA